MELKSNVEHIHTSANVSDSISEANGITNEATEEEFDSVYEYSIDFVGDLVEFCKDAHEMEEQEIIRLLCYIVSTKPENK